MQPGTKPATCWGPSTQLLPWPDQPSGSHTQLKPQDPLLRPCYMPCPAGQCCPQISTNLPAPCPPAVTFLLLSQQRRQRPRLGQLLAHIPAKPVKHPTAIALHSYRSTHTAFYHLASHGNPPNPWEPACMRESPNTTNPSYFPMFPFSMQIHNGRSGCDISSMPHCQVHRERVLLHLRDTWEPYWEGWHILGPQLHRDRRHKR